MELIGLLKLRRGKPALEAIAKQDERRRRNRRVLITIAMEQKSTIEFKSRLVLRGDMLIGPDVEFSSAPTSRGESVQSSLSIATAFRLRICTVDVSQS